MTRTSFVVNLAVVAALASCGESGPSRDTVQSDSSADATSTPVDQGLPEPDTGAELDASVDPLAPIPYGVECVNTHAMPLVLSPPYDGTVPIYVSAGDSSYASRGSGARRGDAFFRFEAPEPGTWTFIADQGTPNVTATIALRRRCEVASLMESPSFETPAVTARHLEAGEIIFLIVHVPAPIPDVVALRALRSDAPSAPVIGAGTRQVLSPEGDSKFLLSIRDGNGDVTHGLATFQTSNGQDVESTQLIVFPTPRLDPRQFTTVGFGGTPPLGSTQVKIVLVDATGLESDPVRVQIGHRQHGAGLGEACDPRGLLTVCDIGRVCTVDDGEASTGVCADAVPGEVVSAEVFFDADSTTLDVSADVLDAAGHTLGVSIQPLDAEGQALEGPALGDAPYFPATRSLDPSSWVRNGHRRLSFRSSEVTGLEALRSVRLVPRTTAGLDGQPFVAPATLGRIKRLGEPCQSSGSGGCASTLQCSVPTEESPSICVEPSAPVIESAKFVRGFEGAGLGFHVSGRDVDQDVEELGFELFFEGSQTPLQIQDRYSVYLERRAGDAWAVRFVNDLGSFASTSWYISATVWVIDSRGLSSERIHLTPSDPLVAPESAQCNASGTMAICGPGFRCEAPSEDEYPVCRRNE